MYRRIIRSFASILGQENLKGQVFRGGAWLTSGSLVEQTFRFGRNMLLARLLAPEAFGTMAVVVSATSVLASLTEVGAREALIQNPRGCEEGHVGAAWWLALGRSVSIYAALFLFAPLISRFYGNGELTVLLRVAAIGLIFEGAISSKAYVAIKELRFQRWAAINHGGGIVGVAITVILSFFVRDVWALVIGYASENAARCALSYVLCPYRPPLGWDREAIRDLLKFSRGLFGLSILNLIFSRTDVLVLAKLYPPAELGLYVMAIYLAQTPTVFLIRITSGTLLPALSRIQSDHGRINRILLQVTSLTVLLGLPALVFLFFCGHSLLTLIYGVRYSAMAPALILASCVCLLNIANSQITSVFYAKGVPQLHRRSVALMSASMIILIYPFVKRFGIVGGQWACLVAIVIGYLSQIERVGKLTGLDLSKYGKHFLTAGAISLSVFAVCFATKSFALVERPLPNIALGIAGCLAAYGLAYAIFLRRARGIA
ncbi:MAG: oligosaccharide flippase family protein [Candidatus Acidiferrales bacterium]